ncbi:MAG: nucleotidyltransferase domain-containing protein [Nanoarchaeota archaeon]|jgi:predicted nucleotidyltransferase|nr:nucleotidyltransferase domain-containing protein [Nanoarchaeota archaeon]
MKEKIKKVLKNIEKENNIKILFAIENGSRAWRMESTDSDYDVRFVFIRPVEDYLRMDKKKDVISSAYDSELNQCPVEGALIDISGFDIFKYLPLLIKSNPTSIEWLESDIIYLGKQNAAFKKFAKECFDNNALYYHYKSLCKNNYEKYIKSGNHVTYKKYLYCFRGILNAKWASEKNTLPPIIFKETINRMGVIIPESVSKKLHKIIKIKSSGKEKNKIKNIKLLDNYIEKFLDKEYKNKKREKQNIEILNKVIKRLLLK